MSFSDSHSTVIDRLDIDDKIYVHLSSGDILAIPLNYTQKLSQASRTELQNNRLIGGGIGIHFDAIDEDISLNGIIRYKLQHELLAS